MSEPVAGRSVSISLQAALLLLLGIALLAGIIPAGIVLDRWLAKEVEARARHDIELAPAILADRDRAVSDALMMHAKDVAHTPALVTALGQGNREQALRIADGAARAMQRSAVLVDATGTAWQGPQPTPALVQATRRGEMPVSVVSDRSGLYVISIAPVVQGDTWLGAAGVATPLDEAAAGGLAALTRSDLVVVLSADGGHDVLSARQLDAQQLRRDLAAAGSVSGVRELQAGAHRYLYTTATFAGTTVVFLRDLRRDLAILPQLRRVLAANGAGALVLALLLGSLVGLMVLRPVRVLAAAAERLTGGDFSAPLPSSSIRELSRVSRAFGTMRTALAARLDELRSANRLLEERQTRLTALQTELIRKERVAVSQRMVAELAHEIRNPVANLRNCLELIYRRLGNDPQGQEYAALAIDELLRMHELAERMLDLNRPSASDERVCDVGRVAEEVAALSRISSAGSAEIVVRSLDATYAAIAPDALKQVLLNLVQNAREAVPGGLQLEVIIATKGSEAVVDVCDNGPGIPPDLRAHVFDAFFTTRATAGGVGLGLFVVEGIVRSHGGKVSVNDRAGGGSCFRVLLPIAEQPAGIPANQVAEEK
jgi:signal transduction histidine kinase